MAAAAMEEDDVRQMKTELTEAKADWHASLVALQTAEEGEAPAPAEPAPAPAPTGDGSMYSLAELQAGCPAGVEAANKEKSLNDEDFEATFKMSRGDFDGLPKWKREKAKKDAGIF